MFLSQTILISFLRDYSNLPTVFPSSRHMLVRPQTDLTFKTTQLPPAALKVATDVVCGVIPCSCHRSCPTTPPLLGHWWG